MNRVYDHIGQHYPGYVPNYEQRRAIELQDEYTQERFVKVIDKLVYNLRVEIARGLDELGVLLEDVTDHDALYAVNFTVVTTIDRGGDNTIAKRLPPEVLATIGMRAQKRIQPDLVRGLYLKHVGEVHEQHVQWWEDGFEEIFVRGLQ